MRTKPEKVCVQNQKVCVQKEAVAEDVAEVVDNDQLTDKQRLFCLYQSRLFNYTKAYMKAYPECTYASAAVLGSRLMQKQAIRDEIESLKQNRLNRELFGEDDLFQMYLDIARADITDFADIGSNWFRVKDGDQLDGMLIQELSQGEFGVKIKLADRMKALDWLTEHMSMATEKQKAELELLRAKSKRLNGTESTEELEKLDKVLKEIKGVI